VQHAVRRISIPEGEAPMSLRNPSLFFTLPAVLLLLTACSDRATPEAEVDSASSEYPREVLQAHMKDHFFKATEMQVAVVNGDLVAVREPAEWMASHANSAAMPKEWQPYAETMHTWALRASEASDIAVAAEATAAMGAACGNCHVALTAEVGFAVDEAPAAGEGAVAHMARHAWASGRMWEGLVAPSGVVWDGGAEVLAEAALAPAELSADLEVLAEVSEMEEAVHTMGAAAVGLAVQEDRARVYGQFLATCAGCHEKTGRGRI
jgi:cytochrome c553